MLVDANILLFAVDERSPFGPPAAAWLEEQLNGARRVGLPWHSLGAFFRLITNPRAATDPLDPATAWRRVEEWLARDVVWVPQPTGQHATVLGRLVHRYRVSGNLMTDAQLAALAIEHGLTVCSADTDFARFTEITWLNPLSPPPSRG